MKSFIRFLTISNAPNATILIRFMVGSVFLSEGIQKFLFAQQLGVGRFISIGIPFPEIMGPFVGAVEIIAGSMLIFGLLTRFAGFVLLINISVAIISTKIPILLGHEFLIFSLPSLQRYGFWSMAHAARTDFCMWAGCLFLIIVGAGRFSIDMIISQNSR